MSTGKGKCGKTDGQIHTSGKRKSSNIESTDSDGDITSAKILVKECAASKSVATIARKEIMRDELKVVISGRNRPMKHYHPTLVNKTIQLVIGNYAEIKLLPSGDLAVTYK